MTIKMTLVEFSRISQLVTKCWHIQEIHSELMVWVRTTQIDCSFAIDVELLSGHTVRLKLGPVHELPTKGWKIYAMVLKQLEKHTHGAKLTSFTMEDMV